MDFSRARQSPAGSGHTPRAHSHRARHQPARGGNLSGGGGVEPRLHAATPHAACTAPRKACTTRGGEGALGGAWPATVLATCAAARRAAHPAGQGRTRTSSLRSATASTHASGVRQRRAEVAPTCTQGLTRARTAASPSPTTPHNANAHATAASEYSRRVHTSHGATVHVAPHAWQR